MNNLLNKFLTTIKTKNRSQNTLDILKHTVVLCQNFLDKPLETASIEDILKFINHVKDYGLVLEGEKRTDKISDSTIFTLENKLIQFYTFCFDATDDSKYHKMVKELKNIKINKPKSAISPKDIISPEEVKKLINVATIERDRCIVATLFESGMRIGELRAITIDMVEINDASQEVTFHIPDQEGCKTGSRSVLCLEIFGYVQDWLKCNPDKMFIPLSENGISLVLRKLYKKAGIQKPSNAHMLRHSSITNACIMKMQPNQISMRYWGIPNSNMLSIYLHLSEQIVNSGYRDAKGLGNGNGNTVINPLAVRCVNCGRLIQSGNMCKPCHDAKKLSEENSELKKGYDELKRQMELIAAAMAAKQ